MLNKDIFSLVLLGGAIIIVSISTEAPPYADVYDKKFIPVMTNISSMVPQNEPIVSSHHYGNTVYFASHAFVVPHGVTSEKSLLFYMVKNNLTYLLVNENFSRIEGLKELFSHKGLKNLDNDFQEIGDYTTDQFRFHLYRVSKNWIT